MINLWDEQKFLSWNGLPMVDLKEIWIWKTKQTNLLDEYLLLSNLNGRERLWWLLLGEQMQQMQS